MKSLLLATLLFTTAAAAQRCPTWDTVYFNGNILTGKDLFTDTPERVKSIAILNGHIVAVDATDSLRGCAQESIDLHNAFVMPGFNDAHTHIAYAGQQRLTVDLDNVPTLAAMQGKLKAYAATLAPKAWIVGAGWDHTKWPTKTLPTRQNLDAVTGDHPAFLQRTDGHIAVANTAALAAAGITGKTLAPKGSQIDLDPQGEPTGILREQAALALLQKVIPPLDPATRRRALQLSIDDALAHGVTSLQDFSDWDDFLVLEAMEQDQQLPLRIAEWLTFNDPLETLKAHRAAHPGNDPWLHTAMLKGFMDGSLGSRTAALAAPYTDDPKNSGLPRYDQKKLNQLTTERAEAGFQIGFHAIGDKANTMALNAFDAAKTDRMKSLQKLLPGLEKSAHAHITVTDNSRSRIEHAQVLLPADFDRFARLGVIASMQPVHLLTDMAWAGDRLGPQRSQYAYAWRSMLDHHIPLAFGTDFPVESINPFRGLYAAVTRQNEAGTATFQPQEKISIHQALYAYTQGSAFAEFAELQKGILANGYLADFIVLDHDPTTATPQELLHTRVLRTITGGILRYTAPQDLKN